MKLEDGHGTIMKDTGEAREIKARTGAKEAEIVAESKKLFARHWAEPSCHQEGGSASKPIAKWPLVTHVTDFHNPVASF